ncbi:class I SAM-dependent rRNA methyltransferase [Limoniibacter endophyticus]|uniref:SAM-dependent methyltransferase n=1 Tax=Limoniibacter endophyticus TaxID=1565040 RepID=A0A8J3DLL9_9HYPH|nr:class I SAM-dependent rRNA methyltransferase [Limoniibacter endophyticus]GHC79970.1 SAM-dependent methyltransferase [Limoniibacter endophyticus]
MAKDRKRNGAGRKDQGTPRVARPASVPREYAVRVKGARTKLDRPAQKVSTSVVHPNEGGSSEAAAKRELLPPRSDAPLPEERLPVILEVMPEENYALLDSGNGRKLEQYGHIRIMRPEGQALWQPALNDTEWEKADAIFTGDTDEEGMGRWRFPHEPLGETWPMKHDEIDYLGRFTSFRHVGVFPEQAPHWRFMSEQIRDRLKGRKGSEVRVLNLFGYTGVASLVAAQAGAHVTHVDASKRAIGWARENQEMAGLADKPIRWICEDAMKFLEREVRRGNSYDILLLDPPAYGRGPKGEVWQLFEDLPALCHLARQLTSPDALSVVLTAYSIRASFFAIHALLRDSFAGMGGRIESGELVIREKSAGRALSTSLFSRWINA